MKIIQIIKIIKIIKLLYNHIIVLYNRFFHNFLFLWLCFRKLILISNRLEISLTNIYTDVSSVLK